MPNIVPDKNSPKSWQILPGNFCPGNICPLTTRMSVNDIYWWESLKLTFKRPTNEWNITLNSSYEMRCYDLILYAIIPTYIFKNLYYVLKDQYVPEKLESVRG